MSSVDESELVDLYIFARESAYICIILKELGHRQTRTLIQADNSTAEEFVNKKIQPKRTKTTDMRFYWLHKQECQKPSPLILETRPN